jgi:hypothetical protein
MAPPNGLQDLCKRVADAINTGVFEVYRRAPAESG